MTQLLSLCVAELCSLAKLYILLLIHPRSVLCGLQNTKYQKESSCLSKVTAETALHQARAAEAVHKI